jgi:hypothetical protein
MTESQVFKVFETCVNAINDGRLINRVSETDKEFHFQNWFRECLADSKLNFDENGRNSFPDFNLVASTEGFEVKGLATPGRWETFDSNSKSPSGFYNGRQIYYVFGRYPKSNKGDEEYPVIDLVIVHGDFLNADCEYVHENKSVKGFGSYGDISIRDRKMYVVPTPFTLADGLIGTRTLIIPDEYETPDNFKEVGRLKRVETEKLIASYKFDLTNNSLTEEKVSNPNAGKVHIFKAYRLNQETKKSVVMKSKD